MSTSFDFFVKIEKIMYRESSCYSYIGEKSHKIISVKFAQFYIKYSISLISYYSILLIHDGPFLFGGTPASTLLRYNLQKNT